jgi:hypothetical protein
MSLSVFYVPGTISIIDYAVKNEHGEMVSALDQEPMASIASRYPGVIICSVEDATASQAAALTTGPVQITKQVFIDMLECLPPLGWERRLNSESFKLSEFTSGRITSIYARVNSQYFKLSDVFTLKHEEIMAKIDDFLSQSRLQP